MSKLVDGGGVDAGGYGPNCSHVIVDRIVYVSFVPAPLKWDFIIRIREQFSPFTYLNPESRLGFV